MPSQGHGKRSSATRDGPPPVKRFRVSRACDQCRQNREKCDGNQPQCAPCSDGKRPCTYSSSPKKRGLPPGYIRTIELALALAFQQDAELEASLTAKLGEQHAILLARETKESNRLHKSWRRSRFCKSLNRALTGEQIAVDEERPTSSGEDSDADAQETILAPELPLPAGTSPVFDGQELAMQQQPTVSEHTPLPPNCWRLLDVYATYTQSWLPICEKLDVLKLSYSYPHQGLVLSHNMPDGALHAEMWSMFTLGSLQDTSKNHRNTDTSNVKRLYAITQTLIPNELGGFALGHVKALLNLAVFNLGVSQYNAAWLLVGAASRILPSIDDHSATASVRRTHTHSGCYLLDNLVALLLQRRPYLNTSDLTPWGKIEEDGLEEWQSWAGHNSLTIDQTRSPILALSTFNKVLEVVDLLITATRQFDPQPVYHELTQRLETWRSSLSPKFDHIGSETNSVSLTPPAILLQLLHYTTELALNPSRSWLQRVFDLMETAQRQLGWAHLPPVVICLLESVSRSSACLPLEQPSRAQVLKLLSDYGSAHFLRDREDLSPLVAVANASRPHYNLPSTGILTAPSMEMHPTPLIDTSQTSPQAYTLPVGQHVLRNNPTSLLEELLPDMQHYQQGQLLQPFDPQSMGTEFTSPTLDAYDPSVSGELDGFFEEIATMHGVRKLQNQPYFMNNLGYGKEVQLADLLTPQVGQYTPMQPTGNFGTSNENEPLQFALSDFYNAG